MNFLGIWRSKNPKLKYLCSCFTEHIGRESVASVPTSLEVMTLFYFHYNNMSVKFKVKQYCVSSKSDINDVYFNKQMLK